MRLRPKSVFFSLSGGQRAGYTLVEILVALTLTLILMTAVVRVFGGVGKGIAKARRAMEQFDRLRTAQQQLRIDLQGLTVTPDGRPARPEENRGYLEFIEGGILSLPQASGNPPALQLSGSGSPQAINPQSATSLPFDLAVGERGDILMFTTRNADRPFVGRYALSADPTNPTMQSDVAEVAWFLRGKTLHRRVLLVAPGVAQNPQFSQLASSTFFAYNDISVRLVNGQVVPNTLGDLTKRENRFAHPASQSPGFPFDARCWGLLGLPTLYECSSPTWMSQSNWVNGTTPSPSSSLPALSQQIDYWDNASIVKAFFGTLPPSPPAPPPPTPDQFLAYPSLDGARQADDVILTNVIGFDVKVWDPAAPVRSFVDTTVNPPATLTVKPGDLRYAEALISGTQQVISYGAYVQPGMGPFRPELSKSQPTPAGRARSGLRVLWNAEVGAGWKRGASAYFAVALRLRHVQLQL